MGRPPLGITARVIVAQTKISELEQAQLEKQYGSVYKGLRAALDGLLIEGRPRPKAKAKPEPEVIEPPAPPVIVPCRIHKNYKVIRRWTDKGQDWSLKKCQDCGYEIEVIDHG